MINDLKATLLPYVREAADLDVWIDEGRSTSRGRTLELRKVIVVNASEIIKPWRSFLAAAQFWYDANDKHSTEDEHRSGMTFDVIPIREDAADMQIRIEITEKVITHTDDEGLIDAVPC